MLYENDKIKVHMIEYPRCREIKTRTFGQIFTVTKHPQTKELCIDWYRNMAHVGSDLLPLSHFSWTVVFENISSGKLYHNDTINGCIVELSPEHDDLRRACERPALEVVKAEKTPKAERYKVIFSDHTGNHVFWTDDRERAHSFASGLRKSSAWRNVEVWERRHDGGAD